MGIKQAYGESEQTAKALEKEAARKKETYEALQESEERYRDLIEGVADVLWEVNTEGIYTYVSPRSLDILGYEPEELLGKTFFEHMQPDEARRTYNLFMEQEAALRPVESIEIQKTHKDGSLVFLESSARPFFNEDGKLLGYRGAYRNTTGRRQAEEVLRKAHDELERKVQERTEELLKAIQRMEKEITERKQAENALRESEKKLRTIFENANDLIAWVDEFGTIIDANSRIEDIFGYKQEEVIGKNFSQFSVISVEAMQELLSEIERASNSGDTKLLTREVSRRDGSSVFVEVSAKVIQGATGTLGVLAIVRDITERKKAEEALKKAYDEIEAKVVERTKDLEQAKIKLEELDRLKSMFIASMSHELRTPLNSIIGFTGVILHGMTGDISAEQRDQLQRVYGAAKHLLALISDVIDISKIEAGKVEAHVEEVNLEGLIKEAISNISPEISNKGLDLEVSMSQDIKLKTDRKRLLQALLNYLSNAVKFNEKGKIRVAIDEVDEFVEIRVKDTGIGIKKEDMPRLFRPFVRLDTHLRLITPGTGLGLYLTKKLATEVLKGSVSAESTYGQGSTFVLKIPKTISEEGGMA